MYVCTHTHTHMHTHKHTQAPSDPDQGGQCSLPELCALGANTASKSACIPWSTLASNGRPVENIRPADYPRHPRDTSPDFTSWPLQQPVAGGVRPCVGVADTSRCARSQTYPWPNAFSAGDKSSALPFSSRDLSRFGDPVDPDSFYNVCGSKGVHQMRAKYAKQLYMNGFQVRGLALRSDVFIRVLAKTPKMRVDRYDHVYVCVCICICVCMYVPML